MKLVLKRLYVKEYGAFGQIIDELSNVVCVTLEHAYLQADNSYLPKLPAGEYTCKRGQHRLASMTQDFTTFEIENVPGHTDILFHWGNTNSDSAGCVLVGKHIWGDMISNSRVTFSSFMEMLDGVDSFDLVVV